MRLAWICLSVPAYNGAYAFTTTSAPRSSLGTITKGLDPTIQSLPLFQPLGMTVNEDLEVDELKELQKIVQEASELSLQADNRVEELQQRIDYLENEISEKNNELKEKSDGWSFEKTSLVAKVAELTNKLTSTGPSERELKLEKELDILKKNLEETKMGLQKSKEAAEELRSRLSDGEDMLEYEQMRFEKEKRALGVQIEEERGKMNKVAKEFENEQKKFAQERDDLMSKLDEAFSKLLGTEKQMAEQQTKYEKETLSLKEKIDILRTDLEDTKERLSTETKRFTTERRELNSAIQDQKEKLDATEKRLKNTEEDFQQTKDDLSQKLAAERQVVEKLTSKLEDETQRFVKEKSNLQTQLMNERAKLSEVESELERETNRFKNEKDLLEEKISEGERIRKLKARQMNDRYSEIRRELTERLEAVKRGARKEEQRLTAKYEAKLAEVSENVAKLQGDLVDAEIQYNQVTERLNDLTEEKYRILAEKDNSERSYQRALSARNMEITGLKEDVKGLNEILSSKEEQITRYETSYREMIKLSLQLTRTRLKKGPTKLLKLVRRQKDDSDNDQ